LHSADEEVARRYENPVDFEHEATSVWAPFDGRMTRSPWNFVAAS
jgi:hypothetical protein